MIRLRPSYVLLRCYGGAGLNRYNGRGIYSSIGRKVLLSGLRNVTNTVEKANRSQSIADAVVNG